MSISDHIRSNVWAIAACIIAIMGTAVVASASDSGPQATKGASPTKQIRKLKQKLASVERRLAALEGKPAPSGPAGGELAGTYPNPTIGTVSGLDLAGSTSSTARINFGSDVNLFRLSPSFLRTDDSFEVGGTLQSLGGLNVFQGASLGSDFGDEVSISGYLNTEPLGGIPAATDCNATAEVGRIVYDSGGDDLYICDSVATSWASVSLTP